jgi:hypothetical protein
MDWLWNPLAWIGLSLVTTVVAWNLAWYARATAAGDQDGLRVRAALLLGPTGAARRAILAGLPLIALWLRVVSPDQMGFVRPSPVVGVLATGLLALGLAVFADGVRARLISARDGRGRRRAAGSFELGQLALGALCLELHWAFLRAAWLAIPGTTETRAVALSLALVAVELLLDPWWREALTRPAGIAAWAEEAGSAVLSAATFLFTGSSVVALVWHLAVRWLVGTPVSRTTVPAEGTGATPNQLSQQS